MLYGLLISIPIMASLTAANESSSGSGMDVIQADTLSKYTPPHTDF